MNLFLRLKEKFSQLRPYQKILLLLFLIAFFSLLIFLTGKSSKDISKKEKIARESITSNTTQSVISPFDNQASTESVKNILTNVSENTDYDVVIDDRKPYGQIALPTDVLSREVEVLPTQAAPSEEKPIRVLLYGVKSNQRTEIREVQTNGTNDHVIAYLSASVKDVHPVSDHGLIYIAGVDEFDHGDRIEIFDTKTQKASVLTLVTPGWGIDDIIISPDNRFLAIWEVKFVPGKKVMLDGLSSVYLYEIGTDKRTQIIVEKAVSTSPIHYPRFFDYKNRLFMDLWVPNQGRQFFLGMSYVEAENPTQILPVAELSRGKFNSAPVLSPMGNKILFSSFDPKAKVVLATTAHESPKRPELDNPNELTILNLDDFTSLIYTDRDNTRFYVDPKWSPDGTEILYLRYNPQLSNPPAFEGVYVLDLETLSERKIAAVTDENVKPVKYLGSDNFIYQIRNYVQGNLGEKYAPVTDGFYGFTNSRGAPLAQGSSLQYISNLILQPKTNLASQKGLKTQSAFVLPSSVLPTPLKSQSVAFETFNVDPLAFRSGQQNDVITQAKDNSTKNPEPTATPLPPPPSDDGGNDGGCTGCACNWNCGEGYPTSSCWVDYLNSECHDSPLYLYPREKTDVKIKPVLSGQIQYEWPKLTGNLWQVVALPDGKLLTQDKVSFDKIEYSFTTSGIKPPEKGIVIEADKLPGVLRQYGYKVGLIDREVEDFVSFWTDELNKVPTPFYFISHYDKESAQKIMSFEITPKPDTFIQIVMYFKPLNEYKTAYPPVFEPSPQRSGFVAVDWSGKIDL